MADKTAQSSGRRRPGIPSRAATRFRRDALTATRRRSPSDGGRARTSVRAGLRPAHLAGASRPAADVERAEMIFVNSMCDLFHEDVPDEFIGEVFEIDGEGRSSRLPGADQATRPTGRACRLSCRGRSTSGWASASRTAASSAGPTALREVPAAVRFISAEPLLGPSTDSTWRDRLVDSRRRVRARRRRVEEARLGPRAPRPLPRRGCRVLLQAVGRTNPEGGRPTPRRPAR